MRETSRDHLVPKLVAIGVILKRLEVVNIEYHQAPGFGSDMARELRAPGILPNSAG